MSDTEAAKPVLGYVPGDGQFPYEQPREADGTRPDPGPINNPMSDESAKLGDKAAAKADKPKLVPAPKPGEAGKTSKTAAEK